MAVHPLQPGDSASGRTQGFSPLWSNAHCARGSDRSWRDNVRFDRQGRFRGGIVFPRPHRPASSIVYRRSGDVAWHPLAGGSTVLGADFGELSRVELGRSELAEVARGSKTASGAMWSEPGAAGRRDVCHVTRLNRKRAVRATPAARVCRAGQAFSGFVKPRRPLPGRTRGETRCPRVARRVALQPDAPPVATPRVPSGDKTRGFTLRERPPSTHAAHV